MIFTHEITLDVTINQIKTLNIKQYTKGSFKLHVNLTDRCEPFKAEKDTHHCYFKMETPDKKHIFTDATINDDGSVDISIPEKACLAAGSGTAELVFKEQAEERIFATMNLNVNIIPSAYHNSHITSSDDFDALQQALFAADKTYNHVMESAAASALLAQSYAKGDTNSRENEDADNARYYKEEAEKAKNTAADYSSAAQSSADTASTKAGESANSATSAADSADTAATKANESAEHAKTSRSYAIGDTDLRENEENDCAKHYYEQAQYYCNLAQDVKDSLGSALRPMGTRTFANLPALADIEAGDMYNVSDQFTTNGNFEEGADITVPAGSNVYKTVGGKWDVLAGSPVTGIKGNAESSYRKGNVNITPANIGLGNVNNTADSAKNVSSAKLLAVQENNYRQGTDLPSTYPRGVTVFLSDNPTNKFNGITYCTIHTIKGYTNMACIQFLYPYNTNHDKIYFREALYNSDSWRPWYEVVTSANIGSQSVNYATSAGSATKATQDGNGNVIKDTYAKRSIYGDDSVSMGRSSGSKVGDRSFAFGTYATASGGYSHAFGTYATASGNFSNAFGYNTAASGTYSHAEGNNTNATASCTHAEGNGTTASGYDAHAEGDGTTASGLAAHAEGCSTTASRTAAHAEGNSTTASSDYSHAEGEHTTANNYCSHASGKFNKTMESGGSFGNQIGDAFVIGNGYYNPVSAAEFRSNALRITYTGDILGTKAFQSSGADYAEHFEKKTGLGEDWVGHFVTIKDGYIYKANEGDYILGIVSGNPSIIGNSDEDYYWRYERDEFNRIVMEDVPELIQKTDEDGNLVFDEETHEPIMIETGNIVPNARMKLAEGYDPTLQDTYILREKRDEWECVGMLGVIPVRDDGTCLPNHFCKCGTDGIATLADNRGFDTYFVIERISDNVVSVILK